MLEVGVTEVAGVATVLIGCIVALWKIIWDQRKKEDARAERTEVEFADLRGKHLEVSTKVAKMEGQVDGSNRLAEKVLEQIRKLKPGSENY